MKKHSRSRVPWLAILALTLLAAPAFAQVPQDMTYTGRLVDGAGNPFIGPVTMLFTIWDAEFGGQDLYVEMHYIVPLDATGGFSIKLGQGDLILGGGPFDATLFSDVNRWLEVQVADFGVIAPRQFIGSVPWALIAERVAPWDPDTTPRFEDCGDGTVADHATGLQWEKKTGAVGGGADLSDPHNVDNLYQWSLGSPYDPDGGAFTDFLARLNGEFDPDAATGCFADRCDWWLPKISELQTILVGLEAFPPGTCSGAPCIDPEFAAVGGPTARSYYWSASTYAAGVRDGAWGAHFGRPSSVYEGYKPVDNCVRAVRAGSCN